MKLHNNYKFQRQHYDQHGRVPVYIAGVVHVSRNWVKVPDLMRTLSEQLQQNTGGHLVRAAAGAHIELVRIHPFTDGSGCTARVCS